MNFSNYFTRDRYGAVAPPVPIFFYTGQQAGAPILDPSDELYDMPSGGDVKFSLLQSDHSDWIILDGRPVSSLTIEQQAVAASLGFEAFDSLPDARESYAKQPSSSSNAGLTGGTDTITIQQSDLPNVTLSVTVNSAGDHQHNTFIHHANDLNWDAFNHAVGSDDYTDIQAGVTNPAGAHTHTANTASINGGVTQTQLNVNPKYFYINFFIWLGP